MLWRPRKTNGRWNSMWLNAMCWLSQQRRIPKCLHLHSTWSSPWWSVQCKIPGHWTDWTSSLGKIYPHSCCKSHQGQCLINRNLTGYSCIHSPPCDLEYVWSGADTRRTASPILRWCREELQDASSITSAALLVHLPSSHWTTKTWNQKKILTRSPWNIKSWTTLLTLLLQSSPDVILCGWPGSKHQLTY